MSVKHTTGGTRQLYCENPNCAAKLVQKFNHFCEKTRMNIEGLSATTLEKFIGHGWIRNFGDLYDLGKNIYDYFDSLKIGLNEQFKFNSTMCGKCCINREDILLNPKDLFNLAKELNLTPPQVVDAYCEPYIGGDSRFPIVRLKPRGSIKRCPLLKDRKCSVHNAKPTVCSMFPIGRCVAAEIKSSKKNTDDKFPIGEIQYIFSDPHCGDYSKLTLCANGCKNSI